MPSVLVKMHKTKQVLCIKFCVFFQLTFGNVLWYNKRMSAVFEPAVHGSHGRFFGNLHGFNNLSDKTLCKLHNNFFP